MESELPAGPLHQTMASPEVEDLHLLMGSDHDVRRLEAYGARPLTMRSVQGGRDLAGRSEYSFETGRWYPSRISLTQVCSPVTNSIVMKCTPASSSRE